MQFNASFKADRNAKIFSDFLLTLHVIYRQEKHKINQVRGLLRNISSFINYFQSIYRPVFKQLNQVLTDLMSDIISLRLDTRADAMLENQFHDMELIEPRQKNAHIDFSHLIQSIKF